MTSPTSTRNMKLKRANFTPPIIRRDIPLPEPAPRVRKHHVNKSVWNDFLEKLRLGDSFVVEYHQLGGLRMAAHRLKIPVVYRTERNGRIYQARVWRSHE